MKRLMFYCQHILGMGHLVRSMEIVRGLTPDFQICFINGGEIIPEFEIPAGVEVVNLPAIKTDAEFQELQLVDTDLDFAQVQERRCQQLLQVFAQFQPDILMIELFPFGRRKFSFELIPLLEAVKDQGRKTQVVCSLRDIVVTKQNQAKHEQKVCQLINQYFDLVLVHGDPQFQPLETSFTRLADLACPVSYTGYVVQPLPPEKAAEKLNLPQPLILASVGGGRFGHDLLEAVVATAPRLANQIPHTFQVFTGPFFPEEAFQQLQAQAEEMTNLRLARYTPDLLSYMQQADLSISMSGYNTTLNILTTGVRAMTMAFTGNQDQEQTIRAERLAELGVISLIQPEELAPEKFAEKIKACLQSSPTPIQFDFAGVSKTSQILHQLVRPRQVA